MYEKASIQNGNPGVVASETVTTWCVQNNSSVVLHDAIRQYGYACVCVCICKLQALISYINIYNIIHVIEMNQLLIDQFTKLVQYTKAQVAANKNSSDVHRLKHFRNALRVIKQYSKKKIEIKNGHDLAHLHNIGKGIIDRIDEILATGELNLHPRKPTREQKLRDSFMSVIGIGTSMANKLIQDGVTSITDLKKKISNGDIKVTHAIETGLKFHGKVKTDIPRAEIDDIYQLLIQTILIPHLHITICGSYRRGLVTSNDIDVLLFHPQYKTRKDIQKSDILYQVKIALVKAKFLKGHLDHRGKTKYMGFCKYKRCPIRRIDIRFVPWISKATALLYFTGSKEFNERIRKHAKQSNMTLNEYGIYVKQDSQLKRIVTHTEQDVFRVLKLNYMEPSERTNTCHLSFLDV